MTSEPAMLSALARLAADLGAVEIAESAAALAARVAEGRFYVACVGQFKRGKSTLINALVGQAVLPVGVVPVTAVVTIVRWGDVPRARVHRRGSDWMEIELAALEEFVSEAKNPSNEKDVDAAEVFVPSRLLASGMCLVDTPGIGSVFRANSEATHAFLPHIDAALVVLGADPPISGDELALVSEVATGIRALVFVLNKADRLSAAECEEALAFTSRVVEERIERPAGDFFRISAADAAQGRDTRQWNDFVAALASLAHDHGFEIVADAARRGTQRLARRLRDVVAERKEMLDRPIDESEERIALLRRAISDGHRTIGEMSYLFQAEQARLSERFARERESFLVERSPVALRSLADALHAELPRGAEMRRRAIEVAQEIAMACLREWREVQEPIARRLYEEASSRFVALANELLERLSAVPGLERLPRSLDPEVGFRVRSEFCATDLLATAPLGMGKRILDGIAPRGRRLSAVVQDAGAYLVHLLQTNSARSMNDFNERVLESRRRLEGELKRHLRELVTSADRALQAAKAVRERGDPAVEEALLQLAAASEKVEGWSRDLAANPGAGRARG